MLWGSFCLTQNLICRTVTQSAWTVASLSWPTLTRGADPWEAAVAHSKSSLTTMTAELNNVWGAALLQQCHVSQLSVQKSQVVTPSANHWAGLGSDHKQVCCSSVGLWSNQNVQCHFSTYPSEPPLLPSQGTIPSAICYPNICLLAAQPSLPLCETPTAEESALMEWKQCASWTPLCHKPASQELPPRRGFLEATGLARGRSSQARTGNLLRFSQMVKKWIAENLGSLLRKC